MLINTDLGRKAHALARSSAFTFDMARAYFKDMTTDEVLELRNEFSNECRFNAPHKYDAEALAAAQRICEMELAQRAEDAAPKPGDFIYVGRNWQKLEVLRVERTYTGDRVYIAKPRFSSEVFNITDDMIKDVDRSGKETEK